jgi:hypothetical protein
MEGLAPPLELLLRSREALDRGLSVKAGIKIFVEKSKSDFSIEVAQWFQLLESGRDGMLFLERIPSPYRRQLLEILERGLQREPIAHLLNQFEGELIEACEDEIQKTLAYLPYKMMIPLLIFMLPAFFLLLVGPVVSQFFEYMK